MDVRLSPNPLSGKLSAIPSKSDAHRKLICAALADKPTTLALSATSSDIDATVSCLRALGANFTRCGKTIRISPIQPVTEVPLLDCGESGSTLRFLLPVAAALYPCVRFTGHGRLPDRPIGELQAAMEQHGIAFSAEKLPFEISGNLTAGSYLLPGDVSSQYITALLLALPLLSGDSTLTLTTPLQSAAYVEITRTALRQFGLTVHAASGGYIIPGGQCFRSPGTLPVEGDWSNAGFFLAAGALSAFVTLQGLDLASTQGDRAILDVLRQFGARVVVENRSVTVSPAPLHGCAVDVREIPDALPILAIVAACAEGETRFVHAERLRLKESDRLTATTALLRGLGGEVTELPDGLVVHGGPLSGGTVNGFRDHRIVMAAAIAVCRCTEPVTITGADAVQKSYPTFFQDYQKLGGICHVL